LGFLSRPHGNAIWSFDRAGHHIKGTHASTLPSWECRVDEECIHQGRTTANIDAAHPYFVEVVGGDLAV